MPITPVDAAATGMFATPSASTGTTGATPSDDKETFLQLLVAQLRYQDPMNPTDSSQFLSQTAQFNALEQMQAVAQQTAALVSAQHAFGALSLVGREIGYVDDTGATVTGVVDAVRYDDGSPVLSVDGTDVALGQVHSVTTHRPDDPAGA